MPAKSKWRIEKIKEESKKYKSRSEFWANSKKAYSAAYRLKILDEVCSHMKGVKQKNYWTKERCMEFAKQFKYRSQFLKSKGGAYKAAYRLKILDEVCSHMPLNKCQKWDYETIKKEALKFESRTDFRKESGGAVKKAYQLGIMDEICSHMKPKHTEKWDPESIKKEALKYDGKKKFMDGCYGAYKAAKKFGIVDEVCSHMKSIYWTKQRLLDVAKPYKSLKKFRTEQKGAYIYASKNGYLNEVIKNMDRLLVPHGHWNRERCMEEAKKYENRTDFMRNSGSAYNACLQNHWVDEVCKHMGSPADGYKHCVYAILNKRENLAYVGITRQLFNKRIKGHKDEKNTANSKEITQLKDTEFIKLTDYLYDAEDVKDAESEWVAKYQEKGFGILNNIKQLGRTGTDKRIHTDEIIFREAKKYKTRVEFKTKSPKIYDAACSQRLLDQACSHMRGIRPKNYWNKVRCFDCADSCKTKKEFRQNYTGAFDASRKNGWMNEICLKNNWTNNPYGSNETPSWLRPQTRKDIWCFAEKYFDIWKKNEKCGRDKMKSLTGLNLDKMIKKFRKGWDPSKDKDWKKWSDDIKSNL